MKKNLQTAIGLTFIIYCIGFSVAQLILQDKSFSALENRNLSQLPHPSKDTVLNGQFGEAFETYIADQFPLRDQFIAIKSETERALQKKETNGVYIGKDGYLLQDFKAPDLSLAQRNASYVTDISHHFPVYMMLTPTATSILADKLPRFATPYSEADYISSFYEALGDTVHPVPVMEKLMQHKEEPIYYKTDHHWTTLGAYYGYVAFCETAGLTPTPLEDFNIENVSTEFYGSLFSKGNFTFINPDTLQIFYPKQEQNITVTYESTGITTDTLYAMDALNTKDKYSVFLDNNHPLIKIKTDTANNKKLLVIKDSYANSLIPFLTSNYEEIHVLDLRLLTIPVNTYAKQNQIDDILVLYNVQNFSTEGKLSLLKQ